jgi:hypothetical protein
MNRTLLMFAVLLFCASVSAEDCGGTTDQRRDLRVQSDGAAYSLEVRLGGTWTRVLASQYELREPRLAMQRGEVAFLIKAGTDWSLYLVGIDGGGTTALGELSQMPADLCFGEDDQRLLLVSGNGTVTGMDLD